MLMFLKIIWYIICAPGWLLLYTSYLTPHEWGQKRNTAQTGRQWAHRHVLAPFWSAMIYGFIVITFFSEAGVL